MDKAKRRIGPPPPPVQFRKAMKRVGHVLVLEIGPVMLIDGEELWRRRAEKEWRALVQRRTFSFCRMNCVTIPFRDKIQLSRPNKPPTQNKQRDIYIHFRSLYI